MKLSFGEWVVVLLLAALAVAVVIFLGFLSTAWAVWWLFPTWAWVAVPLGAPQITYWHFFAIWLLTRYPRFDPPKKEPLEAKPQTGSDWLGTLLLGLLWPVLTYYVVRWMLGM